ncbi:hypothetical protein B0T16DRAFT_462695 [Cercophora newfieldiana]|uniref:Orc1-like AAA ATPase domain-containing protein n=1 Tax=Cercophora newfieldiana TaxID=92897 RepID=A0AA39XSS0_9PEZI|nr:hypothetical protein B0T16DRAFT_462695 [Cercophora newfieldiana]
MPNPLRKLRLIGKGKKAVAPANNTSADPLGGVGSTGGPTTRPGSGVISAIELQTSNDGTRVFEQPAAEQLTFAAPAHPPEPHSHHAGPGNPSPDIGEGVSSENFGLFEFPPRPSVPPPTASSIQHHAFSVERHVDIIVVHGLGGHWLRTWQAPDDGAIWFRDRIPAVLAEANISCRVRSFGYNSAFTFTKGETNIAGSAKDLIDRVQLLRGKDPAGFRPILFVAHSLGGIVVKEALNIAWTKHHLYEDILDNTKGCIFMGVPHHGAGIAKWAKHATQLVKIASLGFSGNTNFLKALERSSPEWVRISRDFVERGRRLSIRTFYETERTAGILVVDEGSAALHVPQEQSFALPGSDHRTVCRFSDSDNERFSLVGKAALDLAQGAHGGQTPANTHLTFGCLLFDLPSATRSFFGRADELSFLRDKLDPTVRGRKGVVLYGLAGSGKTQLILRFIHTFEERYTAVIWINASSKEQTLQSFADTAEAIDSMWPTKDLPNTYRGTNPERKVLSRLRSTAHNRWMLVIDSVDDLDAIDLSSLIPDCKHGSIVVTSTRRSAAELLEKYEFSALEVDSLDSFSASQLLLSAGDPKSLNSRLQDPGNGIVRDIANELYGIPLALEQAGVLIRKRIVTFENFLERYRLHHKTLMAKLFPGATSYEKRYSVITVVSLLFSAILSESPESARLLEVLAILGPRKIPLSFLGMLPSTVTKVGERGEYDENETPFSEELGTDDTVLRLNLSTLLDVCLVKLDRNQTETEEFASIHGLTCQWLVETAVSNQTWDISSMVPILIAFIWPGHDSPFAAYKSEAPLIRQQYLPVLERVLGIADRSSHCFRGDNKRGKKCDTEVSRNLAYIYLYSGRLDKSKAVFQAAVEELATEEGDAWSSTELSLELLIGLASCHNRSGSQREAVEVLEFSLSVAEKLFDNFDDRTAEISSRLKRLKERQEINLGHHKAALLAATGGPEMKRARDNLSSGLHDDTLLDLYKGGGSHNPDYISDWPGFFNLSDFRGNLKTSGRTKSSLKVERLVELNNRQSWNELREELKSYDSFEINRPSGGKPPLMWLITSSRDIGAPLLLHERRHDIDVSIQDPEGQTVLDYAVKYQHIDVIVLLVHGFGVDVDGRNGRGERPITRTVRSGLRESFMALKDLGADLDGTIDPTGWTVRLAAAAYGWYGKSTLLWEFPNVNPNRRDDSGNSALHIAMTPWTPIEHIETLLRWGVDVNAQNSLGRSALHDAILYRCIGRESLVNHCMFLVVKADGANLNLQDNRWMTPLMLACEVQSIECAMILLDFAGTRLNLKLRGKAKSPMIGGVDVEGTAQFIAIGFERYEIVRGMVERGVLDPRERDELEKTNAVSFAARCYAQRCLEYLVQVSPEAAREALRTSQPTDSVTRGRIREAMAKYDIAIDDFSVGGGQQRK